MAPELDLFEIFKTELTSMTAEARANIEELVERPADTEAFRALEVYFHRIAGTAPSVGLNLLGALADACERAAGLVERCKVPHAEILPFFQEGLAAVEEVLRGDMAPAPIPAALSWKPSVVGGPRIDDREGPQVLVIDDDPFSAQMIDACLRDAGYRSRYVLKPEEGLDALTTDAPDLIILDVVMPGMSGFELCRQIRQRANAEFTPILFVTRRGDLDQRLRGLEAGANDYLAKPVEPKELIARVRSHLTRTASLHDLAIRDGLTGCYNQHHFKRRLTQEIARTRGGAAQISLLMLDIDHFKMVNDTHGHQVGDRVLAKVAELISAAVRNVDFVARYGGEEFGVVLANAHLPEATLIANRMRARIEQHRFTFADAATTGKTIDLRVTVSVGVTTLGGEDTPEQFLARADAALYESKHTGRNRVTIHEPTKTHPQGEGTVGIRESAT